MRIQHNIMAMNAYRNYTNNTSALAKNLEKLSSGYRINRAGDDAAGLAISEKMRAQITALGTAQKNVKDGISLVKTAEGATQEVHNMLNRMVELATQSANGTYQDEVDREAIELEFNELKTEINRIADSANFNGIKLLDGSLDAKVGSSTITVAGNAGSKASEGAKGTYETTAAIAQVTGAVEGGTASYTVALEKKSYTVNFTFAKDADGNVKKMVAEDGTEYALATAGTATQDEITKAIIAELDKTDFGKDYTTTAATGKFTFTAKANGTDVPAIKAVDWHANPQKKALTDASVVNLDCNVKVTKEALDDGREIDGGSITEYNGKNYDEAVFTINGKKFVLLTETHDGSVLNDPTKTDNTEAMHAALGLGSDVTILVGGLDGLKSDDDNFEQNCKAIADATGLAVGATIEEASTNGIDENANGGFRLTSKGAGAKGGLMLQIGEDSESYNQMRVSIKDMHVKALGIDGLSLSNQTGAQAAVKSIKDAINYVSNVRSTLGATQNRLEHTQNNLSVMKENIQDAESTIRDTDVAEEMMAYTKNNILVQSAQAMLAQANQIPQGVLQLLG